MININGKLISTLEELELEIKDLSDYQKECMRNDFKGIPNVPYTDPVPRVVNSRQFKKALILSGIKISTIESFIHSIADEIERELAYNDWITSNEFHRDNEMLNKMYPLFGMSSKQVDDLFIMAVTLK